MASYSNFVEVVRERAQDEHARRAYVFLADDGSEANALTYGELFERARGIAVRLLTEIEPGDRVLLLYAPGLEFIVGFFACQLAGAIAVPVYPPRKAEEWPRFASIAADCEARAVCLQSEHAALVEAGIAMSPELARLRVLATDDASLESGADSWQMPLLTRSSLSFLQYTSGSTGAPKGVMVSHGNLLHNEAMIRAGFDSGPDTVGVNWLPQYHDMGLIGAILHPVYVGCLSVLMSPLSFLQSPLRWLHAITKYRGTHTGGPNFGYEICTSRATDADLAALDLSSWRLALNGAEPIRMATVERFAAKFAPCGFRREVFYPSYGLAESTLLVTGPARRDVPHALHVDGAELERNNLVPIAPDAPGARTIVGCGSAIHQKVRIVDPVTVLPCEDGRVGEIWVHGGSVARGYWNRPEATRDTFEARIRGEGDDEYLRTGDLGVLRDGELFVTGRLKELIIVDGRNHYPQDIEETVQHGRSELRKGCGAAFSVDIDGAERLVVVQEVLRSSSSDLALLATEIRADVASKHGIAVHSLLFLAERSVKKTSSGKIRRRLMREKFLEGSLEALHRSDGAPAPRALTASRSDTERTIASLIAHRVGLTPEDLDVHAPFSSFGLDSRALVGLSGELETKLGRRFEPQIFYNYASIAALARFLSGEQDASPRVMSSTRHDEPLAIVGMACRFPGAPSLDAFWELLETGKDAITEVPEGRWSADAWFDPDPSAPGKMATRWGGFIDGVDMFDAEFFGIRVRRRRWTRSSAS